MHLLGLEQTLDALACARRKRGWSKMKWRRRVKEYNEQIGLKKKEASGRAKGRNAVNKLSRKMK